ncbi:hypothetical protein ZIOFF_048474 [Zingiber officinale]|uniref:Uncharacterized protein n=1 Tax=Zingiber officinale TaxID=94328 RepID=A0A8J5KS99_ZINOF|nr:hypothetical protein ZIOFF_048474 [Zingiber officinale]
METVVGALIWAGSPTFLRYLRCQVNLTAVSSILRFHGKVLRPLRRWTRMTTEIKGKMPLSFRRDASILFHDSLAELGVFEHDYIFQPQKCASAVSTPSYSFFYLEQAFGQLVNGTKEFIHISVGQALDSVRWNPINQDEVACATRENHHICLINIFHFSSKEAQVSPLDMQLMLFASGLDGNVYVWDTRLSNHPCLTLTTNSRRELNSIALYQDQVVLGADKCGFIHSWDIRGGQSSHAFQSHNQVRSKYIEISSTNQAQTDILPKEIHSISINPSCSRQLAFHLVDGWSGVLDLSDLVVTHVHCPPAVLLVFKLVPMQFRGFICVFPLYDILIFLLFKQGWNSYINKVNYKKTVLVPNILSMFSHYIESNTIYTRCTAPIPCKSLLGTYAVGSVADKGLYLLDFFPGKHSACHVDFDPESRSNSPDCSRIPENKYIPVSENILACAIHPHNDTIIAGTKESSLMVISQKHKVDNGD